MHLMSFKKRVGKINKVKLVKLISFIIFISPAWDVITDLKSVGRFFAIGSHRCLKYKLDFDFHRQCPVAASNTEYCLYLRSRNNVSFAQPDYINILCFPFLFNYFMCYCLWIKNKKPWTFSKVDDDEEEEDQENLLENEAPFDIKTKSMQLMISIVRVFLMFLGKNTSSCYSEEKHELAILEKVGKVLLLGAVAPLVLALSICLSPGHF